MGGAGFAGPGPNMRMMPKYEKNALRFLEKKQRATTIAIAKALPLNQLSTHGLLLRLAERGLVNHVSSTEWAHVKTDKKAERRWSKMDLTRFL